MGSTFGFEYKLYTHQPFGASKSLEASHFKCVKSCRKLSRDDASDEHEDKAFDMAIEIPRKQGPLTYARW